MGDDARCPVCGDQLVVRSELDEGDEVVEGVRAPGTLRVGKICPNVNCPTNDSGMAPASRTQPSG